MKFSLLDTACSGRKQYAFLKKHAQLSFIMKVSALYITLMALSLQLYSNTGNSQDLDAIQVTVELKNEDLSSLFRKIENQTSLKFFYFPEQIAIYKNISLEKGTRSVKALLDQVLQGMPLQYSQTNNSVIVRESAPLPSSPKNTDDPVLAEAQLTITGKVTLGTGEPLPGVNVIVKNTSNGTTTDLDGVYRILAKEDDILVFSFIGFRTTEVSVSSRKLVDVVLEEDVLPLSEVTVNAGYYHVKDKDKTGSINKVSSEVIGMQPVTNVLQALQGRVPGVYIEQTSGIPGSNFTVRIRGKQSVQNGTDPLYIVDGVPFPSQTLSNANSSSLYGFVGVSPLNGINPSDIESVEILKDADATAIYGSRGANGIVLITTKKGVQGHPRFGVNVSTGFSQVGRKLDLMNTTQYLRMRRNALKNDGAEPEPYDYDVNGSWDTTRYTDWQKELIGGLAPITTAQASLSGGNNGTQYIFSGNYQRQGTVFPGDFYAGRGTLHFSIVNESPNSKFKSRFSTTYIVNNSNIVGSDLTPIALSTAPNGPKLYNEDGSLNWENGTWNNPLAFLNQKFDQYSYNFISDAVVSYNVLDNLMLKASFGVNSIFANEKTSTPSTFFNPAYGITPASAQVVMNDANHRSWIIEPQINWNTRIGANGKIDAIMGASLQNQRRQSTYTYMMGFPSNALINDPSAATLVDVQDYRNDIYKYAAVFGRLNYTLHSKYILNLTGRRDGSSRFGPGKQFANLGAVGAAWIFSKEEFMRDVTSIIPFGKLRASYGATGNDQIGDYVFMDTYRSGNGYAGVGGLAPIRLNNPRYAWETTRKFETALDLGFAANRIQMTLAYFNNRSSNQLVRYKLPGTTGFSSIIRNLPAVISNTGYEFDMTSVNTTGPVKWSSSFNITVPDNKLVAFPDIESSSYARRFVVGKSLNVVPVYRYLGVDPATGIYTFEDADGNGELSDADWYPIAEIKEFFYGGVGNTISYKGLSLEVFFQFVKKNGYQHWSNGNTPGVMSNQPAALSNEVWSAPGDDARYQRLTNVDGNVMNAFGRFQNSDENIGNSSFVRLRNVSLNYDMPLRWTRGISTRFYVQSQNLLTITKYKGLDPENSTVGVLPPLRTIIVGLQLSL